MCFPRCKDTKVLELMKYGMLLFAFTCMVYIYIVIITSFGTTGTGAALLGASALCVG